MKIADSGHYPYGEKWYKTGGANKLKFTSYTRDNGTGESGNDYAMMRSYINRLGRFNAPDLLAGSTANPQSLNRYAYALNDPANLVDPLGLCPQSDGNLTSYWNSRDEKQVGYSVVFVCTSSSMSAGDRGSLEFGGGLNLLYLRSGGGSGKKWDSGHPRLPTHFKELRKASKLAATKKCADFLNRVFQNAFMAIRGSDSPLAPVELPFYYASTAGAVPGTVFLANIVDRKEEDPVQNGFHKDAESFFSTQSINLYKRFFEKGTTEKAQTLLHEGMHLLMNFSDQQLAAAAGVPGATPEQASANFQRALEENCR